MATPENDPRQGPEPLGHEAYRISGIIIIYFPSKWGEGKPDSVALTLGKEGEPTSADVTELPDFQLWGILGEKARQAVLRAYLTAHPDLVTDVRLVRNLSGANNVGALETFLATTHPNNRQGPLGITTHRIKDLYLQYHIDLLAIVPNP